MRVKLLVLLTIFAVGAMLPMEGKVRQRSAKKEAKTMDSEAWYRQHFLEVMDSLMPSIDSPTPEHKVYRGAFDSGYHPMWSSYERQTKATYSYLIAEDGSRIFDGPFLYACYERSGERAFAVVKGLFQNNLQVGHWSFKINWLNSDRDVTTEETVMLDFGDNGLLNGIVEEYSKRKWRGDSAVDYRIVEMRDGLPHGEFKSFGRPKSGVEISGAFFDGKPVGKWTSSEYIGDISQDSNTHLWIAKQQDPQTGDITVVKNKLYYILYDNYVGLWDFDFEKYLMRDSKDAEELRKKVEDEAYEARRLEALQKQEEFKDTKVYNSQDVEVQAEFPGGQAAMYKWLKAKGTNAGDATGGVVVMVTVDTDGCLCDAQVVMSLTPACDAEAMRVVQSMPQWTPASIAGKNVKQRVVLPISFKVQ